MEKEGINDNTSILVIGGSAGSLEALLYFLPLLKNDIPFSIVIVLHRKSDADSMLSDLLQGRTRLPVREIEDKEKILPSVIYVAPANYHVLVEKEGYFSLDVSEKINFSRPSIDVSFETAADVYGARAAALLLSGANSDGTAGIKCIKEKGGKAIIQLPASAEVSYMPQQALNEINADAVLSTEEIAAYINALK
jgi:two-component system, chemotaxis family, protein-glutamate methylesterase/glutaminase